MTDPQALLARIHAAYEAEGFSIDVIGQWALPVNDTADLVETVRQQQPERALEVGTFVGVSTMLIALAHEAVHVVTIDPNFPLEVEMSSMGSVMGSVDGTVKTHDVARAVAERLGIADRITFVSGGYSSGGTFASRRGTVQPDIPIVGPDVGRDYGPFDFAFIDGLHYADVVQSDAELASKQIADHGVMLFHDCIGMWGTNVRTGLCRFLDENPGWRLVHNPYKQIYRSTGRVFRPEMMPEESELKSVLQEQPVLTESVRRQILPLTKSLIQHLNPKYVVEITPQHSFFEKAFSDHLEYIQVKDTVGLEALLASKDGKALVVSAGLPDTFAKPELNELFRTILEQDATAVFLRTPPGELETACVHSRPLRSWVDMAQTLKGTICSISDLDLSPNRFLFTANRDNPVTSSALADIVALVPTAKARAKKSQYFVPLTPVEADLHEQSLLLSIHYAAGFRNLFDAIDNSNEHISALRHNASTTQAAIEKLNDTVSKKDGEILSIHKILEQGRSDLLDKVARISEVEIELGENKTLLSAAHAEIGEKEALIAATHAELDENKALLSAAHVEIDEREKQLSAARSELDENKTLLSTTRSELSESETSLAATRAELDETEGSLAKVVSQLADTEAALENTLEPFGVYRKLRRFFRTVLSRKLDCSPEALISGARHHARVRGVSKLCLMLSWSPQPDEIDQLLIHPQVAALGFNVLSLDELDSQYADDTRIGYYFANTGRWQLPRPCDTVYFAGSWRTLTLKMLAAAGREGVGTVRVRVGNMWMRMPVRFLSRLDRYGRGAYRRVRKFFPGSKPLSTDRQSVPPSDDQINIPVGKELDERIDEAVDEQPDNRVATDQEIYQSIVLNGNSSDDYVSGRVVLVAGNLAPGGAERQVANTLIGLRESGLEDVSFLGHNLYEGPHRYDFHLARVRSAGVPAREINRLITGPSDEAVPPQLDVAKATMPADLLIDISNLVLEFKKLKPEVVHAWLDWDNVRAGLAAAIAGVPKIVLSGRNIAPNNFLLYQPYMDPAYQALVDLQQVTVLNNSRAGGDSYAEWIGIEPERVQIIHNGFDDGGRAPISDEERHEIRSLHGVSEDCFLVGGVFRLEDEKRPLLWLDCAIALAERLPDARFVIWGQGSMREKLEQKIHQNDMADRIKLAGVTDDPLSAMAAMDVFLLCSYGEGLPNVLLEAQSVGTPVVCTDVGGSSEAVDHGRSGWVVSQNTPDALIEPIIALHNDRELSKQAAERAPEFIAERFGMERMIGETRSVYGFASNAG